MSPGRPSATPTTAAPAPESRAAWIAPVPDATQDAERDLRVPARPSFIDAMANLAAAVSVVTTTGPDQQPVGATVTSAVSLSAEPPIVGVSLGLQSRSLAAIRTSRLFAVNILRSPAQQAARVFGGKSSDKFTHAPWEYTPDGLPWFPTLCLATVTCRLLDTVAAGDHLLLLGAVQEVYGGTPTAGADDRGSESPEHPLMYWRRDYRGLT